MNIIIFPTTMHSHCTTVVWISLIFTCTWNYKVFGKSVKRKGVSEPHKDPLQELWLEDFNKDYLYEMQSDSVGEEYIAEESTICPPPPKLVPTFGCHVPKCRSDKECAIPGHRCCYNGCVFTCMTSMPPPPVVDWRKEPPRRLQSGTSWLIQSPEDTDTAEQPAEPCSTSDLAENADALLCPHGYVCHIEDPGEPTHDIPNRGHCVKEFTNANGSSGRKFRLKSRTRQHDGCSFDKNVFQDGDRFLYDGHLCTCEKESITCMVGQK